MGWHGGAVVTLWDWAGQAWTKPGVSAAYQTLQDDHGQCVPLLLWALWLAEAKRTPDPAAIRTAILFCHSIDATKIERLRALRRVAAPTDQAALLKQELEAERVLMNRLESIPLSDVRAFVQPDVTLAAISAGWGHPLAPGAFIDLIGEPARVG